MKLITVFILLSISLFSYESLLNEEFNDLKKWDDLKFPKIEKYSSYEIIDDSKSSYLLAKSEASASGLIFKEKFNVYDFPKVKWKWRIDNVYVKGDVSKKSGDDYPIRIYIIFEYNPKEAKIGDRVKYKLAKTLYGEYPPDGSLNYIWANKAEIGKIFDSPYTKRSQMVVLQSGNKNIGKWIEEEIDIIEDYKKAFGETPPEKASIAIMTDSDNTGESTTAYIDYIKVYSD